jgi:adenylate cyclase
MPESSRPDPARSPPDRRKLIAVVYADMVGYSRLIGLDDAGTLQRLRSLRSNVIDPAIEEHNGRIVQTGGDSLLIVFDSIAGAMRCSVQIQQQVPTHDGDQPPDRPIRFRIGINIGDAIADGTDLHGDAVNVAARLQAECPPGDICVTRAVRDHVQDRLDLTFEELGALNLKNIARPVEAFVVRADRNPAASNPIVRPILNDDRGALPLPDKPSIAVLAFTNMSGDPAQEFFSDGIADGIIAMLAQSHSLFVIARNSSFSYKGRAIDIKRVAHELGVRYVLEGSVRRGGDRVRVNAELIDAASGNNLWTERYNRDVSDVFEVQDEIAEAVAIAIEPEVARIERHRAIRRPPGNLSAWEAYQRGLWHMARVGAAENEAAEHSLRHAIALDPNLVRAHAWLSIVISSSFVLYQRRNLKEVLDDAYPAAQRAVFLDPSDALAHIGIGTCHMMRGDRDGAMAEARQARGISPNLAGAHSLLGIAMIYSGQPREGIEHVREGMRLDPHYPIRHMRLLYMAIAYYFLGEYHASIDAANEGLRSYPNHPLMTRFLAAALGQVGRLGEGKVALQHAVAFNPGPFAAVGSFDEYASKYSPWIRREDYAHMLDGLRKAGLEG